MNCRFCNNPHVIVECDVCEKYCCSKGECLFDYWGEMSRRLLENLEPGEIKCTAECDICLLFEGADGRDLTEDDLRRYAYTEVIRDEYQQWLLEHPILR